MRNGGSESDAFAQANGVANKEAYIYSGDVMARRMLPMYAEYRVLGGNSSQACAACRWFVSPDACVLVQGDINPGGICKHYLEEQVQVQEPSPVVVVGDNMVKSVEDADTDVIADTANPAARVLSRAKSIVDTVVDRFRALPDPPVHVSFQLKQVGESELRWYLRVSNNFTDRARDIISEAAHKEYVAWADKEQAYPELWVWHAKGSRLGVADWLDVSDGVLVASGTIDEDRKEIARSFADDPNIGTSHGFLYARKGKEITRYRSYEISLLPMSHAANLVGGGLNLIGDVNMPFTAAKKQFLIDKFGPGLADQMEKDTETLAEQFRAAGIEYKEVDVDAELGGQLAALTKAMAEFTTSVNERMSKYEGGLDKAVEEAMTPRLQGALQAAGFKASESDTNVGDEKDPIVEAAKKEATANGWFNEVVVGAVTRGL